MYKFSCTDHIYDSVVTPVCSVTFVTGDSVTNLHSASFGRFHRPIASEAASGDGMEVHKWLNGLQHGIASIYTCRQQHTIKVVLAGDYEFLSTKYGLSGASDEKSIYGPSNYQHATCFREASMTGLWDRH